MNKNKKIVFGILIVVVLILAFLMGYFNGQREAIVPGEDAVSEEIQGNEEVAIERGSLETPDIDITLDQEILAKTISESKIAAPGVSPLTKENKLINYHGEEVVNNVSPSDLRAPATSDPVNPSSLSEEIIKLEIVLGAFSPTEFRVKRGQAVNLSLTSKDEFIHALVFIDPSLSAINLTVSGGETRVITFIAPDIAGEYVFKCPVGGDKVGHVARGEVGKMIVE